MNNEQKILLDFIKEQTLCVLATVHANGTPEAAVIEFGETPQLEIIFDTLSSSRKYANLIRNPNVALVIGWDENITAQFEGIATELAGEDRQRCTALYFSKNPRAEKWQHRENIRYFKVTPRWIRYSDLRQEPWKVFELRLPS